MMYDQQSANEITEKYKEIGQICTKLLFQMQSVKTTLKSTKAQEYLMHGVGRRLNILGRCIENIFFIYPMSRADLLNSEELFDLAINLHAFFINISGVLDNLGWVFVHEKNLLSKKLTKHDVGLFNIKTQVHFPEKLSLYLKSDKLSNWYSEYTKNYRDALAHRIPLCVAPAIFNEVDKEQYLAVEAEIEALDLNSYGASLALGQMLARQRQLGQASPYFAHSLVDEGCRPVMLHAQLICDYVTVEEIICQFCNYLLAPDVPSLKNNQCI